jgi:hypothetical protein
MVTHHQVRDAVERALNQPGPDARALAGAVRLRAGGPRVEGATGRGALTWTPIRARIVRGRWRVHRGDFAVWSGKY